MALPVDDLTIRALQAKRAYHAERVAQIDLVLDGIETVLARQSKLVTVSDPETLRCYGWDLEPQPKSVTATIALWEVWGRMKPQTLLSGITSQPTP